MCANFRQTINLSRKNSSDLFDYSDKLKTGITSLVPVLGMMKACGSYLQYGIFTVGDNLILATASTLAGAVTKTIVEKIGKNLTHNLAMSLKFFLFFSG